LATGNSLKDEHNKPTEETLAVFVSRRLTTAKSREVSMSLSLQDIKDELRESYLRTEEVLSGIDAYVAVNGCQEARFSGF
jgi:hypothetical protein